MEVLSKITDKNNIQYNYIIKTSDPKNSSRRSILALEKRIEKNINEYIKKNNIQSVKYNYTINLKNIK